MAARPLPVSLRAALDEAGRQLGDSFHRLGWLNGEVDAPMPEQHTVLHLASALRAQGFAVAPEVFLRGKEGASRRRVDLLAHRPGEVFVFEVKTFGGWHFDALEEDVDRLLQFGGVGPQTTPFTDMTRAHRAFWEDAVERWGCVVIQSFRTPRFPEAWAQLDAEAGPQDGLDGDARQAWKEVLRDNRRRVGSTTLEALESLLRKLHTCGATFGTQQVSEEILVDTGALHLLWAAFPLLLQE